MTKLDQGMLQQLYHSEGKSIRAIANTLHVSPRTVYDAMIQWRIPRRPTKSTQRGTARQGALDNDTLRQLYLDQHQSIRSIAEHLDVPTRSVASALMQCNIPRRYATTRSSAAHGRQSVRASFDEATLRTLYLDESHSIMEIAATFNVSPSAVRNALRYWQIPRRRKGPRSVKLS